MNNVWKKQENIFSNSLLIKEVLTISQFSLVQQIYEIDDQEAVGRHEKVKVYGNDYNTKSDYIHVTDLAQGHVAALNKLEQGWGYKVYNMGTGRGSSVLEMIKTFE